MSPSKKRRPSSEQPWGNALRGMTSASGLTGGSRYLIYPRVSLRTGRNRLNAHMFRKMKLAPSSLCNSGLENQTTEHTAEIPASADSKTRRVAKSSPVTHQTLRQQGGTGEDDHIQLADWTLSVVGTSADSTTKCVANSYTPNSTAAKRTWRRRPHSSCRLGSRCSGDREEAPHHRLTE